MIGRLTTLVAFTTAALFAVPLLPASAGLDAQAQQGARFRVLIPDLFPAQGTDDDFGKDVAEKLREAIDRLPTHQAIDEDELKDQLRRFDVDMEDLNCLQTRQLASQINAQVVVCADYTETARDQFRFENVQFWDVGSSQALDVEGFAAHKDDDERVAQRMVDAFDRYVQQLRHRQYCFDYAQSDQWDDALRNCNQALEINPDDTGVLYQRARVHYEMEDHETALEELKQVLEAEPFHDGALQLAGYIAAQLGRKDESREFYGQYLELNPGAADVRRRIAYELGSEAEGDDPEGAMLLIQKGLEVEDNPDLRQDLGNYAFAAAAKAKPAALPDTAELPPEVAGLYRTAIDAYLAVFDAKGAEMPVSSLRNVVNAHLQLNEVDRAIEVAERFLEVHPDAATLWSGYADALRRDGQLDEALAALDEVQQIDPDYQNLYARQGQWLLNADRAEEAVPYLVRAVERGQDPNNIARLLLAEAHSKGIQNNRWGYAIDLLQRAKSNFDLSAAGQQEMDFWHAYALFQRARTAQEPGTPESARSTLGQFQRAQELFTRAREFAVQNPNYNYSQLVDATEQFIEIQEAILKRAGGL